MSFNPKLTDYVNAGISRGFSESHIADVLRKHGHKEIDIREAFSRVRPEPKAKPWFAISMVALTLTLLFVLLLSGPKTQSMPTAAVVGVNDLQASIDKIAALQSKVDLQQQDLDDALAKANEAELSASEKEKLLADLQDYYAGVKQEREETKSALFDLWTFLFAKTN